MSSGIKVVLCFVIASVLLGFTQIPIQYAEGAVSWNGFLKQVGFGGTQVYEVSHEFVMSAGETRSEFITILCSEEDWMLTGDGLISPADLTQNPLEPVLDSEFHPVIIGEEIDGAGSRTFGVEGHAQIETSQTFDIEVTVTILCLSPSTFQAVGGEWQATDTTALIIGYSVLNAYWIAPIGIGIGLGIYLVKRRF